MKMTRRAHFHSAWSASAQRNDPGNAVSHRRERRAAILDLSARSANAYAGHPSRHDRAVASCGSRFTSIFALSPNAIATLRHMSAKQLRTLRKHSVRYRVGDLGNMHSQRTRKLVSAMFCTALKISRSSPATDCGASSANALRLGRIATIRFGRGLLLFSGANVGLEQSLPCCAFHRYPGQADLQSGQLLAAGGRLSVWKSRL